MPGRAELRCPASLAEESRMATSRDLRLGAEDRPPEQYLRAEYVVSEMCREGAARVEAFRARGSCLPRPGRERGRDNR